jgi:hypothetical protein
MDLDDFIIAVFCLVDEAIPQLTGGYRLRERGPQPILADSEVLTMESWESIWGWSRTRRCLPTSGSTMPTSSRPWPSCTGPRLCAKRRICGGSKNACGRRS